MTAKIQPQHSRFTALQIVQGLEAILIIISCYLTLFLKPIRDRWGLTKTEADRKLPGDELVPGPKSIFSHGITINAPSEFVWPWVAQMGKGRGGFYSYEALENIMGLDIYNAETILSQYQNPEVGDIIPFGPDSGFPLALCEKGRSMVIVNSENLDTKKMYDPNKGHPENFLHVSWLWHVESLDSQRSRFISRNRVNFRSTAINRLKFSILGEPIVFTMDRKMCLGIKKRAERSYRSSKAASKSRPEEAVA